MHFSLLVVSSDLAQSRLFFPHVPCFILPKASCPAISQLAPFPWGLCTPVPMHLLPISWCRLKAHTQNQRPSVLTAQQNYHRPWSAREASAIPGPHPSSECDRWVGRAPGEAASAQLRARGGGPQPAPSPTKSPLPYSPHAGGGSQENLDNDTETDSLVSAQRERPRRRDGPEHSASSLNPHLHHPQHLSLPLPLSYPPLCLPS